MFKRYDCLLAITELHAGAQKAVMVEQGSASGLIYYLSTFRYRPQEVGGARELNTASFSCSSQTLEGVDPEVSSAGDSYLPCSLVTHLGSTHSLSRIVRSVHAQAKKINRQNSLFLGNHTGLVSLDVTQQIITKITLDRKMESWD